MASLCAWTAVICAALFSQRGDSVVVGRVAIREGDRVVADPAGTIAFWVRHDMRFEKRVVEVAHGEFQIELPRRLAWVDSGLACLDGQACRIQGDLDSPQRGAVSLTATPVEPTFLAAVDARDGRPIPALHVLDHAAGWHAPASRRVEDVRSPWEVPAWWPDDADPFIHGWIGTRPLLVRAPGMAWTSVTLDPATGRTHVVELHPEAALSITIGNDPIPPDVIVELSREGAPREHDLALDRSVGGMPIEIDALAHGAYWVSARIQGPGPRRLTDEFLARERVELAPGDRRPIRLRLRSRDRPIDAHGHDIPALRELLGVVQVPAEWSLGEMRVDLERFDPATATFRSETRSLLLKAEAGCPGSSRFVHGLGECGRWRLTLRPIPWRTEFDLVAGSHGAIDFVMPPPARIDARVVDSDTGAPIADATLAWFVPGSGPSTPGDMAPRIDVARDAATGSFSFRVPVGEIVLVASGMGHAKLEQRVRVESKGLDLVLRLHQSD